MTLKVVSNICIRFLFKDSQTWTNNKTFAIISDIMKLTHTYSMKR